MITISTELLLLIIRVQLFSNPQQTQAPRTNKDPVFSTKLPAPSKPRMMLASVTSKMAAHSRLVSTSLKMKKAISDVATISKLFSSDTLAELVRAIPSISRMGAAISSTTMATVYGSSFRVSGSLMVILPMAFPATLYTSRPRPAPRYRNAAIIVVPTCSKSNLESGTLMA